MVAISGSPVSPQLLIIAPISVRSGSGCSHQAASDMKESDHVSKKAGKLEEAATVEEEGAETGANINS